LLIALHIDFQLSHSFSRHYSFCPKHWVWS
jgi:hypothetical protein